MKYFILLLCFLFPFGLAYLINEVDINFYVITAIIVAFTIFIIGYLNKNNEHTQFSLKSFFFKTKKKN